MNRRNALIQRLNPARSIKTVNHKFETKEKLAAAGVPVPPTIALVGGSSPQDDLLYDQLPDSFAIKPNCGSQGRGVILVDGRCDEGWYRLSGDVLTYAMLQEHIRLIEEGEYSLDGIDGDHALIEPLIRTHPDMARLVPYGLPDIRIICLGDVPLMAMTRLPTEESDGRANLHQGAVGAAIDLRDGSIFRAVLAKQEIYNHPSTGMRLIGAEIPFWNDMLDAARRCSDALNLGYVGVDLVIDAARGVQVLECNAYPGLEIQNVNGAGLAKRIEWVERRIAARQRVRQRSLVPSLGDTIRSFTERLAVSGLARPYSTPALHF